jgi:acetyltransferase-like isoleucine patch superfamily enzyme
MISAIKEVGLRKALRFFLGLFQVSLIKLTILPPNLRRIVINVFGAHVGADSIFHSMTFVNLYRKGFRGLVCGEKCYVGEECLLDLADAITLGDHVTLAGRVSIVTHTNVGYQDHPLQEHFPSMSAPVIIGSGSFVGMNVTILPGVEIGERAVIAAGSVVIEDVPGEHVVAGVPSRIIRKIYDRP